MIKYDPERKTVFGPSDLKLNDSPSKCLLIFDDEIWEELILPNQELETFPVTNTFGRVFDTYRYIKINGEKILLVYPTMGSAGCVCDLSEISDIHGNLFKHGYYLTKEIERHRGIPTYYYLQIKMQGFMFRQ